MGFSTPTALMSPVFRLKLIHRAFLVLITSFRIPMFYSINFRKCYELFNKLLLRKHTIAAKIQSTVKAEYVIYNNFCRPQLSAVPRVSGSSFHELFSNLRLFRDKHNSGKFNTASLTHLCSTRLLTVQFHFVL